VLRGRCACNAVAYEVSDEFVAAFNCHCSNCRAATGSAFLPWGEIEREKLRVTKGSGSLLVVGDREKENGLVAVRARSGEDLGSMSLAAFAEHLKSKI